MKEYESQNIRNLAIVGHSGCGKTSLVSALCFTAGSSSRLGSVDDGTSLTDFSEEEIERRISTNIGIAYAEWKDAKINLLDTPGFLDFHGEVKSALRVADGAVIVVHAATGVEVGTEIVWKDAEDLALPRLFFINMMDKEHANFDKVFDQIKETLSKKVVPVEIPIGSGDNFKGIINLFTQKAHVFKPGTTKGEFAEEEISSEMKETEEKFHQELVETVAETDDNLLERYLDGDTFTREEIIEAAHRALREGLIYPLFCGAATNTYGVRALLTEIVELVPSPVERGKISGTKPDSEKEVGFEPQTDAPLSALIFKTTTEPHVGELSYFRIFSGSISSGDDVFNSSRNESERLSHLSIMQGKERKEVAKLNAGDIGVIAKLKVSHTNDTLCYKTNPIVLAPIEFPHPTISEAIKPKAKGDEEKISTGLSKLHEEDPTFNFNYEPELQQTLIHGMGEVHLDIIRERLKRKFGVDAEMEKPKIPYRETIKGRAEGQGKYKKQSGGRGQYGDTRIKIEPLAKGSGYEFVNEVVGGAIPSKYIPSVDKGIQEAAEKGVLAGYPLVDFRVTLYDGTYHSVDSSDIAFKIAGSMAFQKVSREAKPVLLEPIQEVRVGIPEEYMGEVMGDLNSRRGKIQGVEPDGRMQHITALVPQSEMYKYANTLRSITQGRGAHSVSYSHYEEVPHEIAQKIIAESADKKEE